MHGNKYPIDGWCVESHVSMHQKLGIPEPKMDERAISEYFVWARYTPNCIVMCANNKFLYNSIHDETVIR